MAPDGGTQWRDMLTPQLKEMGIRVLNPCNKPISIADESIESREYRQHLLNSGQYDKLAKEIKLLRIIDLRMVDVADFLIVNFDTSIPMCGTMEEVFLANRQKKPVLFMCPQGKSKIYHWMFGTFPHKHMFGSWPDLMKYVNHIDQAEYVEHDKRWVFFDWENY